MFLQLLVTLYQNMWCEHSQLGTGLGKMTCGPWESQRQGRNSCAKLSFRNSEVKFHWELRNVNQLKDKYCIQSSTVVPLYVPWAWKWPWEVREGSEKVRWSFFSPLPKIWSCFSIPNRSNGGVTGLVVGQEDTRAKSGRSFWFSMQKAIFVWKWSSDRVEQTMLS